MELKPESEQKVVNLGSVLIVPYGIETKKPHPPWRAQDCLNRTLWN